MEDMHSILEALHASETDDVLATIIHVDGSAYKKEGAAMLFKADGSQHGLLSAGCLEEDLAVRIQSGLGKKKPETIVYDMRGQDDLAWGEGSGCNGVIHVLAEPVNQATQIYYHQLKTALDSGESVVMVKQVNEMENLSFYLTEEGTVFGSWPEKNLTNEVRQLLNKIQHVESKASFRYITEDGKEVYLHRFEPKPRLIIFGAGKDAVPLAAMAAQTGFSVTVTDWRPAFCVSSAFPTADQLIIDFPGQAVPRLKLKARDYVVILTHNFQKDREILTLLGDTELKYLGVLGSSKRVKRILGVKEIPAHITSPIGLSIHAEGPEEIAVSIMAELIKVKKESFVGKKACVS